MKTKILKFLKKTNKYHLLIGGLVALILILLLLGVFISTYKLNKLIKGLIIALYAGLVIVIVWRDEIGYKKIKRKKHFYNIKRKVNKMSNKKLTKKGKKKIISLVGLITLITGIVILSIGVLFFLYIVIIAPSFNPDNLYHKEASVIYDYKGNVIRKIGKEIRDKISYHDLPQVFIDAIIATEDSRYFQHNGFDFPRFLKASAGQMAGQNAGGASTITMQVVRNNLTSNKQSIIRKFTDIYLAIFKLERKYTKEEILEFYVNTPFLGNHSYGVSEASRNYFGKEIQDINLSEAALLAGLFQAPSIYDPYRYPENAERRRTTVLYLMKRHGYINKEEEKIANAIAVSDLLIPKDNSDTTKYQGYIDTVVDEIETKLKQSPYNIPMKIYTNYDDEKQTYLHKVLTGELFTFPNDKVQVGIAVTNVKTGAIVAVGNGRNRSGELLFNLATDSRMKKQIGSTAKPIFEYGAGIENENWSTGTLFLDDSHAYSNGVGVKNWDNKYFGLQTMRMALVQSRNIPALRAFQQLKNKDILNFATSLGIEPEIENGKIHEAHAIGAFPGASPLQMAAAYAAFGNSGYYIEPYAINKIEYLDTNEVKIFKPVKKQVMSDATAFMITDILRYGVDSGYVGAGKVSGIQVAAKSGSTNFDSKTKQLYNLPASALNDFWYAGYTADYAIGLWYGYENIADGYHTDANYSSRERLFTTIAKGIFANNTKSFTVPDSVIKVKIEKETAPAMLPSPYTPSNMIIAEYFKKGTEPTETSPRFNTLPAPTNLDIKTEKNNLKLTWDHITVPSSVTPELIKVFANHKDKYLNLRTAFDLANLGTIGYNVYLKQNKELILLGWTDTNQFTHKPLTNGTLTYVVKACYSIFKANISDGAEITLSEYDYIPIIEVILNGNKVVNLNIGEQYEEKGITVLDNLVNVTNEVSITKTTTRISDNKIITNNLIDTSAPESYEIKYIITYKEFTYNEEPYIKIRTIIIE